MNETLIAQVFDTLRRQFKERADPLRAQSVKNYFKEPIVTYGLSVPQVRTLARAYLPQLKKEATLEDVLVLCERLLATGSLEEGLAVETLMGPFVKRLTPEHFPILDRWVDYFSNWAVTDGVSAHIIGALLERHPELVERLVSWTASHSRWRRRAACVSLVLPVRHDSVSLRQLFAITDPLMLDRDDMVQKGAGWILRDMSALHQDDVVEYLQKYPAAGRILVRYVLEKMPAAKRAIFITDRSARGSSSSLKVS